VKRVDMTGRVFGRLTALEPVGRRGTNVTWRCRCECGTEVVAAGNDMRAGLKQSCGCLRRELAKRTEHGHMVGKKPSPTYSSWRAMLKRCYSPRNRSYADYGGRGIIVCERWRSFEPFLSDMGDRPEGTSLDRIDVNGNYEPGNCRWLAVGQQQWNRRCSVLSPQLAQEIVGRHEHGESMASIGRRLGINRFTVNTVVRGLAWSSVTGVVSRRKPTRTRDAEMKRKHMEIAR
jgi:hypothetical protein